MSEFQFPTEVIDLPSKGLIYPESSPLSKGTVEMKYMSAKEEDILTNQNYLQQGIVIDKLLQSMIVTKINYDELISGDKSAILFAARILGYGAQYDIEVTDKYGVTIPVTVDLSQLENKTVDESIFTGGKNEFNFLLPQSKVSVTFKLLTHGDEKKIEDEIKGLKKINPQGSFDVTTRLKHQITAINGDSNEGKIRTFVDNMMVMDSRALRKHINEITPDINAIFSYTDSRGDVVEGVSLPMNVNFLYPDANL